MKAEYINPFVMSTIEVFSTMMNTTIKRGELSLNSNFQPEFDVSGIIGLSGKASGSVVISLESNTAIRVTEALIGELPDSLTDDVIDAVGELANMVAGSAKRELEELQMEVALPTVITGKNHVIRFASDTPTIAIPYHCEWGGLSLEVGLVEGKICPKKLMASAIE